MSYPNLPVSVTSRVEMHPAEDICQAILAPDLPDIKVLALIEEKPTDLFVLVRRRQTLGTWGGDSRFVDHIRVQVHCFAQDPDGDERAALLAEAVRVVFRDASRDHRVLPGLGSIVRIDQTMDATRRPDWATSTGPVQYADLPTGYQRYESEFEMWVRKPRV